MVRIYSSVLGNISSKEWAERLKGCRIEYIELDQWSAQKSRFVVRGSCGGDFAIAMNRHLRLLDGDIIRYDKGARYAVVVRLLMSEVMEIDLSGLDSLDWGERVARLFELGHAIGNQHWPAVVRGTKVYIPLTVDKRVMSSVMNTHRIEGIRYEFKQGESVIPYLSPYEIRCLFGAAELGDTTPAHHHSHRDLHGHSHDFDHD